jgi:hypothetical protein
MEDSSLTWIFRTFCGGQREDMEEEGIGGFGGEEGGEDVEKVVCQRGGVQVGQG